MYLILKHFHTITTYKPLYYDHLSKDFLQKIYKNFGMLLAMLCCENPASYMKHPLFKKSNAVCAFLYTNLMRDNSGERP